MVHGAACGAAPAAAVRGPRAAGRAGGAGYSLIELVVALAILGLTLTLVATGGARLVERASEHAGYREIEAAIAALRVRAAIEERRIELGSTPAGLIPLDPGWKITAEPPLVFLANGVCLGGHVAITAPSGRIRDVIYDAPECAVRRS